MTHTRQHVEHETEILPIHVRHHDKVAKITKRSRLWCEIATCAGTAYETHLIILMVVSVAWLVADVALIVFGIAEEL